MKRRKNLERAIVLSLLLSTSVYGNAFATDVGPIGNENNITEVIDDVFVKADTIAEGDGKGNIILRDDEKYEVKIITTGGNIQFQENDGTGILVADKISSGTKVTLSASGDIIINADYGIQANAKSRDDEDNNISVISLTAKNNKITANNVGIYSTGGVDVLLTADSNEIIAAGDYGIQATESSEGELTLTATNGDNIVKAENGTAIRANGEKVITLDAAGNNIVIGGVYGIENTQTDESIKNNDNIYTNLDAVNNIVYGADSAIKSDGAGITDITASESNTIGQYTDDKGTHTSNTGINATAGVVDISSTNNTEIYGKEEAIYNKDANISIEAGKNIIVEAERKNNKSIAITNDNATLNLDAKNISVNVEGAMTHAISNNNNGTVIMEADNNIIISAKGTLMGYGIYTEGSANTEITNTNGLTQINAEGSNEAIGIIAKNDQTETIIDSKLGNVVQAGKYAVRSEGSKDTLIEIKTEEGSNILEALTGETISSNGGAINLSAAESNFIISDKSSAIFTSGKSASVTLTGKQNYITGLDGIENTKNGSVSLTATGDNNSIFAIEKGVSLVNSDSSAQTDTSSVNLITNKNNEIYSKDKAIYTEGTKSVNNAGNVRLDAANNILMADNVGIETQTRTSVNLEADNNNNLQIGNIIEVVNEDNKGKNYFGDGLAIKAVDEGVVTLTAGEVNNIYGAVHATGSVDKTVKTPTNVTLNADINNVYSAATIDNAGGLKDTTVISALYAEAGAQINVSGSNNTIMTYYSKPTDDATSERVIWAYDAADIAIDGATTISTAMYDKSPNNMDIAIAAGTATGLGEDDFTDEVLNNLDLANVTLNYENNGERKSSITGDILSAYGGVVDIKAKESVDRAVSDAGIDIYGNLLAGNTGVLNVDIGKGSILTGRADDYGDADVEGTTHGAGVENGGFFNPAFSSEIITGGEVNLTMGEGSTWNVTGQSWITELNTKGTINDTYIDLVNAKTDLNTNASALTIGTLNGDTTFHMNLDGNRSASDMLYIKNADGKYQIDLAKAVTNDEINKDGFDGLRFATVGTDSNVEFTVGSYDDGGAFNVEYTVDTDSYEGNSENSAYNSTTDGSANVEKPGNASVDDFFGLTNNAADDSEIATNGIMLMAENEEVDDNAANANTGLDEVTNFKIIARAGEELNDTGETILNMSRANYSNAIYMDRLNKRLGEARYINGEEEDGMWVRIRHDRIGKTDAYRSQNTMYELGYDQKQDCDNGERRVGFAVDYMHGDTGYSDIAGKGEIDRYGLWLYDTWMGNKGHYVDYVAKWGHLSNDFEVYTMRNGDKVTGDYSNNVFSVSAEYGRKKDMGNDWYVEPQAQLQLARVTGADYTTNQGTKVSVDGINSLIGRAGFRLGKDFGEEKQSTVYIKADVLHEFLGDQDVYVYDKSSDNKWAGISYENEGTWYDVGFGFATMMSKNSYAFLDLEKSFGHDNDETYQINAGVQWTF